MGVDANRNFGFEWSSGGSSSDPCSITFAGPDAFSEPEAVAVRDYILNRNISWQGFVTLHSYSQVILLLTLPTEPKHKLITNLNCSFG